MGVAFNSGDAIDLSDSPVYFTGTRCYTIAAGWQVVSVGEPTEPCAECRGTGKYTGLTQVENCRACGGKGSA